LGPNQRAQESPVSAGGGAGLNWFGQWKKAGPPREPEACVPGGRNGVMRKASSRTEGKVAVIDEFMRVGGRSKNRLSRREEKGRGVGRSSRVRGGTRKGVLGQMGRKARLSKSFSGKNVYSPKKAKIYRDVEDQEPGHRQKR